MPAFGVSEGELPLRVRPAVNRTDVPTIRGAVWGQVWGQKADLDCCKTFSKKALVSRFDSRRLHQFSSGLFVA